MAHLLSIEGEALNLVIELAKGCTGTYEGSWTSSVYDTAWVSMVQRSDGAWLLPQCFQYVLHEQKDEAGWTGPATIDSILHTLAALLAIEKHLEHRKDLSKVDICDLKKRKQFGVGFLEQCLRLWDVETCLHVGFELLVPSLLSMLEGHGIMVDFPGRHKLSELRAQKLKNFRAEDLYGPTQVTALHSLEAFVDMVDLARIRHHKVNGSILGSPSATAAFLMRSPDWDDDMEDYLIRCARRGGGHDLGGMPSAYPAEVFEFTWVSMTFDHVGLLDGSKQHKTFTRALDKVASQLQGNGGVVGFSYGLLPDADDTAKAIHLLNAIGRSTSPESMISHFMSPRGHMMTYPGERDLSPSANCNALLCLLDSPDVQNYCTVIEKIARLLCERWWDQKTKDKWNLSSNYTSMLLCQAFVKIIVRWDAGDLPALSPTLLSEHIVVVLFQIINRTIFGASPSQRHTDGPYTESVAYEVLASSVLMSLPLPPAVSQQLATNLEHGKAYISTVMANKNWESDQYLWIEKVTYGSKTLAKAYCLAALYVIPQSPVWRDSSKILFDISEPIFRKLVAFFHVVHGPSEPIWKYQACILESKSFFPRLQASRSEIFPLRAGFKDKYLQYIPITWTLINNFHRLYLPTRLLWEMMKISLLDFLVDEYMESCVALLPECDLATLKAFVQEQLLSGTPQYGQRIPRKRLLDSDETINLAGHHEGSASMGNIRRTLRHYVKAIIQHPKVKSASEYDQFQVRTELRDFLLAHLVQTDDNKQLSRSRLGSEHKDKIALFPAPRSSFYSWARTTASQHISCPLSFAFYKCLLTPDGHGDCASDCFATPTQKYKADDLCAHLAVMSRLFNDYASLSRDQRECNLNSINFPEFHADTADFMNANPSLTNTDQFHRLRQNLLQLGEYERQACRSALRSLVDEVRGDQDCGTATARNDTLCKGLALFAYVTELYADMYVAKDLTNEAR
ncbi:Ent-kaurene synthase [Amniculicola lignicola CBS 123094]|uniref:Ent-kaurene synthase n=1 Tax=Amniculicola lignicola CBS 123094 TaxID=1392246 RepID=A0A6A5W5B3_9PLEO|nr:Ent-kaurene synthase [Amniculicola lignicola CBS 123094]